LPLLRELAAPDPTRKGPDNARPVHVRGRRLAADSRIQPHRHLWAQVAYSAVGVLHVTAGQHTFIVPPSRAVWIPPEVEHVVSVVEDAELRTLYLHMACGQRGPRALDANGAFDVRMPSPGPGPGPGSEQASLWQHCRVLEVSPLLRELVEQLHLMSLAEPTVPPQIERENLLVALVQDELHRARAVPLGVGLPADKRLLALCEAVLRQPSQHSTLQAWSAEVGASVRTVSRLFRSELGTTFAQWRQQVLLAKALSMAARKRPMAHIAAELGYASPSAFTAMVKRSVGLPPKRFFAVA